jgi:hypothetical protein
MVANGPPSDQSALSREIEAAFKEQRAPSSPMANIQGWHDALHEILDHGHVEPVVHAVKHLRTAFLPHKYVFLETLHQIFERMPPADESYLPFQDVLCNDVQIVRRENAETVMFVFCGRKHKPGLPTCIDHRWLGRLPVSLVYLRDFQKVFFLAGISSLGQDRGAALDSLRRIVTSIGGRRTVCYGYSGGAFAALHYGLELESDAVLCLSGVTNVSSEFNSRLRSAKRNRELPRGAVDLRHAYSVATRPPRVRIIYAKHNWDDRLHAQHMEGLPTVTLQAVPAALSHNVVVDLVNRGEYEGVLGWLVSS